MVFGLVSHKEISDFLDEVWEQFLKKKVVKQTL